MVRRCSARRLAILAWLPLAAAAWADGPATRPRDPWVFRSVLDGHARMLTCELNDKLIVAYDTQTATLRRAWAGNVLFTGGVYDARHGPQPQSVGPAYFSVPGDESAWTVTANNKTVEAGPHYLGYRVTGDAVTIDYAFETPGGRVVLSESPEYRAVDGGVVLERTFLVNGLPGGTTLHLSLAGKADDPKPTFVRVTQGGPSEGASAPAAIARLELPPAGGPTAGASPTLRLSGNGQSKLSVSWSKQ